MSMVMAGGIGRVPGICGTLATFAAIGALLGAADGAVPTGGAIRSPLRWSATYGASVYTWTVRRCAATQPPPRGVAVAW